MLSYASTNLFMSDPLHEFGAPPFALPHFDDPPRLLSFRFRRRRQQHRQHSRNINNINRPAPASIEYCQ